MEKNDKADAIATARKMFGDNIGNILTHMFDCMDLCGRLFESEIAKADAAQDTVLGKRLRDKDAWTHCSPPAAMRGKDMLLYESHVKELIERVKTYVRDINVRRPGRIGGPDLEEPTDAEVLLALSEMSLKAPFTTEFQMLMEQMFCNVYGEEKTKTIFLSEKYKQPKDRATGHYKDTLSSNLYALKQRLRGQR